MQFNLKKIILSTLILIICYIFSFFVLKIDNFSNLLIGLIIGNIICNLLIDFNFFLLDKKLYGWYIVLMNLIIYFIIIVIIIFVVKNIFIFFGFAIMLLLSRIRMFFETKKVLQNID